MSSLLNIKFDKFILPEKMKYTTSWLNSQLYETLYNKSLAPTNNNLEELPRQTYIRNYLNIDSPYRGLLLFHGLGTGKSCTSILTAENLKSKHHIFILLPASLEENWKKEIINVCGDSEYKNNPNLIYKYYTFIKYNSSNINLIYTQYINNNYIGDTIDFIYNNNNLTGTIIDVSGIFDNKKYNIKTYKIKINNEIIDYNSNDIEIIYNKNKNVFSNKVVIIDEIHNLVSMYKSSNSNSNNLINNNISNTVIYRNKTYSDLIAAINTKILLLSGTPIINNIRELKYILNIIHGNTNYITIKINIINQIININELEEFILSNNKHINIINIKQDDTIIILKIVLNPDYFIRENDYLHKIDYIYSVNNLLKDIESDLFVYFTNNKIEYSILDILPIQKNKLIMDEDDIFEEQFLNKQYNVDLGIIEYNDFKNIDYLKILLIGKLSYLKGEETTLLIENNIYTNIEQYQYSSYNIAREKEITIGLKSNNNINNTSKLRALSRQLCLIAIKDLEIEDDNIDIDINTDDNKNTNKKMNKSRDIFMNNFPKNKTKLNEYINKYSTKYYNLIQNLSSTDYNIFPKGKVLIYSEYRELGVNLIGSILEKYNYKSIISLLPNINKYFDNDIITDTTKKLLIKDLENIEPKYKVFGIYNSNTENKYLKQNRLLHQIYDLEQNDYGNILRILFITKSGSEGLSFKSIRQIHIMEPFWHITRKRQVIGRGIRYGSHIRLKKEEQNVQVYNYIAKFDSNIKISDNIQKYDNNLTSDEYIYKLANKKQILIDKLYNIFKTVSIDCPFNLNENINCMNFPLNNIESDNIYNIFTLITNQYKESYRRAKLITYNNKNYIAYKNKIYDYDIYKDNKSFIEIGTYKNENENEISINILSDNINIPLSLKQFEKKGTYGVNNNNKIYIDDLSTNNIIKFNNITYIVKLITDNYIILKHNNNSQKYYIYSDTQGKYIIPILK